VIRELRLMGITAGSLFPGLDGACEELGSGSSAFEIERAITPTRVFPNCASHAEDSGSNQPRNNQL
jgi:hypothetical protein